ncbi:MAG TPA: glycosyltransferase 87 family protein [Gaiellaceae bacterium]|nr:glycosyltransferase 87 family protein [Gaiellaceae bacterium]
MSDPPSSPRPADARLLVLTLAVGLGLLTASWAALHLPPFDRSQIVDTPVYQEYGEAIAAGQVPYRDFELEYPPGALPVFWLPTLAPEEHYRSAFELLMWALAAATLLLVLLTLYRLGAAPQQLLVASALVGVAPLVLGSVVLTRYDHWPALLGAAALAALVAGRDRLAFAVLGLAAAAKIYPLVFLPPMLVHVARTRGRSEAGIALGVFVAAVALVVVPLAVVAPDGLAASLERQVGRPLQIESLGASILLAANQAGLYEPTVVSSHGSQNLAGGLPDGLAAAQTVVQALVLVAVWALFARGPATPARVAAASAASVVVFVALGKVLSPQFLIWLVPLVPLVLGRGRVAVLGLLAAALAATHLWFPSRYWDVVDLEPVGLLVLVRNVLLLALAGLLVALTLRREPAEPRSG